MTEPNEPQDEQPGAEQEVPSPPTVVHVAPYHWWIEGRDVFLRTRDADGVPAADTEDEARRIIAEALAHRQ